MADAPSDQNKTAEPPAPEVLKPRDGGANSEAATKVPAEAPKGLKRPRRATYHPSHKATFIGLAVVVAILAVNAGIIAFVLKSQAKSNGTVNQDQVTLSQGSLDKLGLNRSAVGDLGVLLTVGPDAKFNGKLTVGKDVSIGGHLELNNTFTASDANLAQLEAGNTSIQKLNVNGDTTSGSLNLRQDLLVTGTSRLQGPTVMSQLLTVNNNVNISGSVAVGGVLSVNSFHASSMVIDSSFTIGGHFITRGSAPGVSRGSALGSNGSVSISGNDAAGTVAANAGVGATTGSIACVSFVNAYSTIPHVVVSASAPLNVYVGRTAGGFCIYAGNAMGAGNGYAFDYIVEQ
ncbi:MAG TPA: hypothetical protein VFI84_00945 [Candidatus Saccharimonadales bacterium]|nr:hypothetical protein [Candidatus Saccharimonadales bacterium]